MNNPEEMKWCYQPVVVIHLIFFVLGPFGLPLVYKSPKFNKTAKVILTVFTIFYTVYLVDVTVKTTRQILSTLPSLQALLG